MFKIKRILILGLVVLGIGSAQSPPYTNPMYAAYGGVLPTLCNNGNLFYNVFTFIWYGCGPINTWGLLNSGVTPAIIVSGTATMGTSPISANSCARAVTIAATGTLTTSRIIATTNANISGITGYGYMSTDGLKIYVYPTAGNVNFQVCNPTSSSITPGSAIGINYLVI